MKQKNDWAVQGKPARAKPFAPYRFSCPRCGTLAREYVLKDYPEGIRPYLCRICYEKERYGGLTRREYRERRQEAWIAMGEAVRKGMSDPKPLEKKNFDPWGLERKPNDS